MKRFIKRTVSQRDPETEVPISEEPAEVVPGGAMVPYQKPDIPQTAALESLKKFPRLDPHVRARIRRHQQDPFQLSWDASADPKAMLEALLKDRDFCPAQVLLPPAHFMAATLEMLRSRTGGFNVSNRQIELTLHSAARFLAKGNIDAAVDFLMPVRQFLAGMGPDPARAALADIVRRLYPQAPAPWTVLPAGAVAPLPAPTTALPAPEGGGKPPAGIICGGCGAQGRALPDSSSPLGWRAPLGWALDDGTPRCGKCRGTPGAGH